MANYQVKMTPVETFFFGGEKHRLSDNGDWVADYFSQSGLYPQQTTLFGFVRYLLLQKNKAIFKDNKIINKPAAVALIGEGSFNIDNLVHNYGKIKTISPLYFTHLNNNYFFGPFDLGCILKSDCVLEKQFETGKKEYTAKEHDEFLAQYLISSSGIKINIVEVVKESTMVGNEKGIEEKVKDNAFYKQTMKYLSPGWSFAFDISLEGDAGLAEREELYLPFGGEKSYFKVEVLKKKGVYRKQDIGAMILPIYQRDLYTIICLSDIFLKDTSVISRSDFAITEFVSFRNLQSKVNITKKYSGLSKTDPEQLKQSGRLNLLQRGSVLYFNDLICFNKVKADIEADDYLINIGFNHILTIAN